MWFARALQVISQKGAICIVVSLLLSTACKQEQAAAVARRAVSANGGGSSAGSNADLPPCSTGAMLGLVTLNPIKAELLEIATPRAYHVDYPSGQKTVIVDMEAMDSTKNEDYTADYAKFKICLIDPDPKCPCIERESGTWLEEVMLPPCMGGEITVEAAACAVPERRKGEADCGSFKSVILRHDVVNPESKEFDLLQKMKENEHARFQLGLKLVPSARKLLAYLDDKAYKWPKDPKEKQKVETLQQVAKSIVYNPHLVGATFQTHVLGDLLREAEIAEENAKDFMPPQTNLALADAGVSVGMDENGNQCAIYSGPATPTHKPSVNVSVPTSDLGGGKKASDFANTNTGYQAYTPMEPDTSPQTSGGPDDSGGELPTGSQASGDPGDKIKGYVGAAMVVTGVLLLTRKVVNYYRAGRANRFQSVAEDSIGRSETGMSNEKLSYNNMKGKPVSDNVKWANTRVYRPYLGDPYLEILDDSGKNVIGRTKDLKGNKVNEILKDLENPKTKPTTSERFNQAGEDIKTGAKSKANLWTGVYVLAAIGLIVGGSMLIDAYLLASDPVSEFGKAAGDVADELTRLKAEYQETMFAERAIEDAATPAPVPGAE